MIFKNFLILILFSGIASSCFVKSTFNNPTDGLAGLFLNGISQISIISKPNASITITGIIKDSAGNIVSGGVLDITKSNDAVTSGNIKNLADSKIFSDINGKFIMNVFLGNFSIRVSRSDGSFVGSFIIGVKSATESPDVLSSIGIQVSSLTASPISTGGVTEEPLKVVFTGLPQVISEGQTILVQVKLSKTISSDLEVTLDLDNPSINILGASSKKITFTSSNAGINQSFSLTAIGDTNQISETVILSVKATGIETINYTLTALDTSSSAPVISISSVPYSITEGSNATIGIKLTGNVSENYTVTVASSRPSSLIANPSTLTFTSNNFSIDKLVTLTAVQDENVVPESVSIILSSPGLNQVIFQIITIDDDTQNIVLSGTTSLNENSTSTINVKLTQEPISNVVINLSSSVPSSLSLATSSLTFTPLNYNTPQVVTINAIPDGNETSETAIITASSSGITSAKWDILCIDVDTKIVFTGLNSVTENGTTTLAITLSGNPGISRMVSFASGNPNALSVSPSSVNFTSTNFNTTQALTVTGVVDANVISESVTISASGTGLITSTRVMNVVDKDTMSIVLGGANTVNEGLTATMTVALSNDPSGNLTVNLNSNNAAITLSPTSVGFSSANYNSPQNITLTGVKDTNQFSETVTITASANNVNNITRSIIAIDSIGAFGLLATGQTTSYATGDDGNLKLTWARSFTDNNDGSITDNVTGLVYQKCSMGQNPTTCSGTASRLNWDTADSECRALNLGQRTWRLPTVNELSNIINYNRITPAIFTDYFPATPYFIPNNGCQQNFVTSSIFRNTNTLYAIDMYRGQIYGNTSCMTKTDIFYVRCISGPAQSTATYTDNGNGTVTDNLSGLLWQKCSVGQSSLNCSGAASRLTWANAISTCNALSLGSGLKWRLPNINELRSLGDYSKMAAPHINTTVFPNTESYPYWTSTTSPDDSTSAFYIQSSDLLAATNGKVTILDVRCVAGP